MRIRGVIRLSAVRSPRLRTRFIILRSSASITPCSWLSLTSRRISSSLIAWRASSRIPSRRRKARLIAPSAATTGRAKRDSQSSGIATAAADTRWDRIVALYDQLLGLAPSPTAQLARAVAVAEAEGPEAGLAALTGLDEALPHSHRLPAVRGELLDRAGRSEEARGAYALAMERCGNEAERTLLAQKLSALSDR